MIFRYIEVFFYIFISQTDNWTYFAMIYSMYTNAGLITIFYPFAVFGYALLNEVRPDQTFWRKVMAYSLMLLIVKFVCSIDSIRILMMEP